MPSTVYSWLIPLCHAVLISFEQVIQMAQRYIEADREKDSKPKTKLFC